MSQPSGSRDLVRIVLGVLLILLLISGALSILSPFLPALIWATMIVVATWPLLLQLQRALGGRRSLAAAAMTALLFVIVIAPIASASPLNSSADCGPARGARRCQCRSARGGRAEQGPRTSVS